MVTRTQRKRAEDVSRVVHPEGETVTIAAKEDYDYPGIFTFEGQSGLTREQVEEVAREKYGDNILLIFIIYRDKKP